VKRDLFTLSLVRDVEELFPLEMTRPFVMCRQTRVIKAKEDNLFLEKFQMN
jgi:hypothetical protein